MTGSGPVRWPLARRLTVLVGAARPLRELPPRAQRASLRRPAALLEGAGLLKQAARPKQAGLLQRAALLKQAGVQKQARRAREETEEAAARRALKSLARRAPGKRTGLAPGLRLRQVARTPRQAHQRSRVPARQARTPVRPPVEAAAPQPALERARQPRTAPIPLPRSPALAGRPQVAERQQVRTLDIPSPQAGSHARTPGRSSGTYVQFTRSQ